MKVIVDHRERSSGIIKELYKRELEVEIKELKIADYVLHSKNGEGKIQTVGIERKTQNDFLNSIIDKRLVEQLLVLKENFDIPILIIEGEENMYEIRNFHPNAIRGMLASIAVDFQIPTIFTKSVRDTAGLIAVIAKRLEKPRKLPSLLSKRKPLTTKEHQEYIIESLPGIGPTLARSLLKKFKTIESIINASEEELKTIDKLGPKKISAIKKVLKNKYK
ncbi:MAG: ERCC4 domain-containing protein [Candidatus Nanoarchaeia archaeon]|nr:ERCC4 domain-containing protein [Candidatus Nanoarchaeia archaeon]